MRKDWQSGRETPDPTPVALPIGFRPPEPLAATIARLVGVASQQAARAGAETFEESEDFDTGEDLDPRSPWEEAYDRSTQLMADAAAARAEAARRVQLERDAQDAYRRGFRPRARRKEVKPPVPTEKSAPAADANPE